MLFWRILLKGVSGFGFYILLASSAACGAGEIITQVWHSDYTAAIEAAKEQGKYLFVFFHESDKNAARKAFETRSLVDAMVRKRLQAYECASLPMDASITIKGKETRLLDHPAFQEMQGRQGIAILDFACPGTRHYGQVVNVFPFDAGRYYGPQALRTILALPPGTLTQRTMIYAVRMHPERPASTRGVKHPVLSNEAQAHSEHQAQIRVQGHHGWGWRFQRILSRLRFGSDPVEVVAESWPGENVVEAAVDCVASWRQSPGHWKAVSGSHGAYGYDMKRGANGIWYATGIFAGYRR